jgi:hypothetical protein
VTMKEGGDPDEVIQHKLQQKFTPKVEAAVEHKVTPGKVAFKEGGDPDEVMQHKLQQKVASKVEMAVETFNIILDEETESYKLVD